MGRVNLIEREFREVWFRYIRFGALLEEAGYSALALRLYEGRNYRRGSDGVSQFNFKVAGDGRGLPG